LRLLRRRTNRSERSLYWRCRRGEPEALATFAYRVADELYVMSLEACSDEATAAEAVRRSWQRTLGQLGRWRFGGYLERRARRDMVRVLGGMADTRRARAAARATAADFGDEALRPRLPEPVVAELVEAARVNAPDLQRRSARRRRQGRVGLGALALVSLAAIGLGAAYRVYLSEPSVRAVRVETLRDRIVAADMVNTVRDVGDTLADPEGADRAEAEMYGQAVMALEEIANAGSTPGTEGLFYVQKRAKDLDLSGFMLEAAQRQEGETRATLIQAHLALEEVAAL
jgi:hypothetical protein